jgi:serine/threonine protein kinase
MAVYEYCDHGDLFTFAKNHRDKVRDPAFLRSLASGVLEALAYLHENGYAHCDIKPENILLSHDFRPVLADFGMAQQLDDSMVPQGTPSFLAPEVARSWASGVTKTKFDPNIDVFSLGVSAIHLLTGRYPFRRISAKLERRNRGTHTSSDMEEWFQLSFHWAVIQQAFPEQAEFIFRCLAKDPERRPTAKQLLESLRAK